MITTELSNEQYHAEHGVSSSLIKTFLSHSPLAAWHRYVNPDRPKELPSRAMFLGTLCHTLVLEPEKFEKEFPAPDARTDQMPALNTGVMKPASYREMVAKARAIAEAVRSHPMARGVLYPPEAVCESSVFAEDPGSGLKLKCRPDMMVGGAWAADLKTTSTSLSAGFRYQAKNLGYHLQEAFYRHVLEMAGAPVENFYFVVVETLPPHDVVVYQLNSEIRQAAEQQVLKTLKRVAELFKMDGPWPGLSPETILPLHW